MDRRSEPSPLPASSAWDPATESGPNSIRPFGVSVWLCDTAHRSQEFQRRRAGRDFVLTLSGAWQAAGVLTRRRQRALEIHQARLTARREQRPVRRPGSYSWPGLRAEAEARWAAGDPARVVIDELRARHRRAAALAPSRATMHRWFREARWAGGRESVEPREEAP